MFIVARIKPVTVTCPKVEAENTQDFVKKKKKKSPFTLLLNP